MAEEGGEKDEILETDNALYISTNSGDSLVLKEDLISVTRHYHFLNDLQFDKILDLYNGCYRIYFTYSDPCKEEVEIRWCQIELAQKIYERTRTILKTPEVLAGQKEIVPFYSCSDSYFLVDNPELGSCAAIPLWEITNMEIKLSKINFVFNATYGLIISAYEKTVGVILSDYETCAKVMNSIRQNIRNHYSRVNKP